MLMPTTTHTCTIDAAAAAPVARSPQTLGNERSLGFGRALAGGRMR
ncbi:MAG TPA: hypothetical protein VNJ53_02810 [Gaiellaceae bacterium]|nr:hypothetical protein [Gaiellaceae bacterium]